MRHKRKMMALIRPRNRRFALCALVVMISIALSLCAATYSRAASETTNKASATAAICAKQFTVYFYVTNYYPDLTSVSPVPNGCWSYARIIQNTSSYRTCHSDGSADTGTGSLRVYDDTNPANVLDTESGQINTCATEASGPGSLRIEYMARRSQRVSWCNGNGYSNPCWRRNPGSVSVYRYGAEVYSGAGSVANYWSAWWGRRLRCQPL